MMELIEEICSNQMTGQEPQNLLNDFDTRIDDDGLDEILTNLNNFNDFTESLISNYDNLTNRSSNIILDSNLVYYNDTERTQNTQFETNETTELSVGFDFVPRGNGSRFTFWLSGEEPVPEYDEFEFHNRGAKNIKKCSTITSLKEKFECRICLNDYEIGTNVLQINCNHKFCITCAEKWFSKCNRCPLCNKNVDDYL